MSELLADLDHRGYTPPGSRRRRFTFADRRRKTPIMDLMALVDLSVCATLQGGDLLVDACAAALHQAVAVASDTQTVRRARLAK